MKRSLLLVLAMTLAVACDTKTKTQLRTLALTDSLRADSIIRIKNEMLDEVMQSTQFLNDINTEVAKLKLTPTRKLATAAAPESEMNSLRNERTAVKERIRELVARLDSSEARLASLRSRAASLSTRDAQLTEQVAQYERTIADLRSSLDNQRTEFQTVVDRQNQQIAALNSKVDTVTRANVQLAGERAQLTTQRAALIDTVSTLIEEKNTAYYVIGTKEELIKSGVLVEEGRRRLLVIGSRPVTIAREFDPAKFMRIDRLKDRQITLPAGEFTIFSRQNPAFVTPGAVREGKVSGSLRIDDPLKFWEPSRFLVIVKN
jgi:predicted  nucleic acid-binding Zn-ribbon protein